MEQPKKAGKPVSEKIERDPNTQHKDHPAQPAPKPGKENAGDKQVDKGKRD